MRVKWCCCAPLSALSASVISAAHAGGRGGAALEGAEAIEQVAPESRSFAPVFWGHRIFIEYFLHGPSADFADRDSRG